MKWLKLKKKIFRVHKHKWEYQSGGRYDIGSGWGLRYRTCVECGEIQRFEDMTGDYLVIERGKK